MIIYNKWNHKPENKVLTELGVKSDAHFSNYKVWLKTIFSIQSVGRQTLLLSPIFILTLLRATCAMCRLFAPLQWTLILDYLLLHHSKVIVHRLEEELVVRPIENILEVAQRNLQNR